MDRQELFQESNYKSVLKRKQKSEVRLRPQLTWKFIAEKICVQHTYLSRSFSKETVHLNEDHLFEVCELLKFDEEEKEYVQLLRARSLATSEARRAHLQGRIDQMVKDHYLRVNSMRKEASPDETDFLLNPVLLLIFVSLHVKKYANTPALLEKVFALKPAQLVAHLKQLDKIGMISYDREKHTVREVKKNTVHFSKEHPLMRGHQQILRHLSAAKIARAEDHEKVSFMATFSASEEAFTKIKEDFYKFLSTIQAHAQSGEGQRVYQLGFDLFHWD